LFATKRVFSLATAFCNKAPYPTQAYDCRPTKNLYKLIAVAEALSFTRAAENLHLAQPSLTRQIKDLEAEIGVRLFDRAGKRISLTSEGESFLLDARQLLTACAQSVQAVQRLSRGEAGQLNLINIGYVKRLP
jgi:DNA-binding transcriptional LysR family regulator